MDFTICDEQRAFVDTVRKVRQKEFMPRAINYLDGSWPADIMRIGEIGVLGMSIPEESLILNRGTHGTRGIAPE